MVGKLNFSILVGGRLGQYQQGLSWMLSFFEIRDRSRHLLIPSSIFHSTASKNYISVVHSYADRSTELIIKSGRKSLFSKFQISRKIKKFSSKYRISNFRNESGLKI